MVWDTQGKLCQPKLDWMQRGSSGDNGGSICVGGCPGSGTQKTKRVNPEDPACSWVFPFGLFWCMIEDKERSR